MAKSSKVDVAGVGLNATDTLIPLARYPSRGSKVEFRSANVLPGGQVASAMIACQHWGLQTCYVGKVGEDSMIVRLPDGTHPVFGQQMHCVFEAGRLHWFDPATGARISD